MRNSKTPEGPVELTSSARVDFSTRLAAARASRGEKRVYLAPATTTSTTEPPPPPTTVKPRVIVRKTTPTTAKPKPAPAAKPKPASSSSSSATASTSSSGPVRPMPAAGPNTSHQDGKASYYEASYHAQNPWICAHRTLPMGTVVTVTNVATGKSITCEVGDRGPYAGQDRILDLSKYAFSQLANPSSGVISVHLSW
ncbi:MAG TPA: septal ring lytic transglycosylase RlpA family protein [Acidimicrobiales bacterium]|nr:septal ring lytic transglycosylase RlpA family protein [Acidimicrobiales bacterium]